MQAPIGLVCPVHMLSLQVTAVEYVCPDGCRFPIVDGIPRFVDDDNYAESFGLQWRTFRQTQLDSYTGVPLSHDRLARIAGGSLDVLAGKQVLEVGCGAGRFTQVMLAAGARVFAVDISTAVEANRENCQDSEGYFVCQASVYQMPVPLQQFDVVVCVGVIQHTPDPEKTMAALCGQVRPGGLLLIDHYPPNYPGNWARKFLRQKLLNMSSSDALKYCSRLIDYLWPVHQFMWKVFRESPVSRLPFARQVRSIFIRLSPIVDYHDAYLELGPDLLKAWALLDTHDTLTDVYKHLRSQEQIAGTLRSLGMVDIVTGLGGNGVEARAKRPVS